MKTKIVAVFMAAMALGLSANANNGNPEKQKESTVLKDRTCWVWGTYKKTIINGNPRGFACPAPRNVCCIWIVDGSSYTDVAILGDGTQVKLSCIVELEPDVYFIADECN